MNRIHNRPGEKFRPLHFFQSGIGRSVLCVLGLLAMLASAESYFRRDASLEANRRYRQAHCFEDWMLVLCPGVQATFPRPDGRTWDLTTNEFSERITPSTATGSTQNGAAPRKEVWFIGDSISMGYLLDDRFSPPWVFEETAGRPTRNLGSDSLGTVGILTRLERSLQRHPDISVEHVIWIYNTSDFSDDPKETRLRTSLPYRSLYRAHFSLARLSSLYLRLRGGRPDSNILPPGFEAAPPSDHPTWQSLRDFRDWMKGHSLPFTILVYPGFDPRSNGPATSDPTTAALIEFLQTEGFEYRDLSQSFVDAFHDRKSVYIPGDGHPDEDMAFVFAQEALDAIQSAARH